MLVDSLEPPELMEKTELVDLEVTLALKENKESKVLKVFKEFKEKEVPEDSLVLLVLLDLPEKMVLLDLEDLEDILDLLDLLDLWVCVDLPVLPLIWTSSVFLTCTSTPSTELEASVSTTSSLSMPT